jgi:signal peptidase I
MSRWWWVAATAAGIGLAAGATRWRYSVVTVHGPSMEPELADGDRLLACRCGIRRLRTGQLVIFREPGLRRRRPAWLTGAGRDLWVVKRVAAIPGDPVPDAVRPAAVGTGVVPRGAVVVLGDAPSSRDSRQWGFITASQVLGVARRRL